MEELGRYRIEARLGEGAMADVYRAADPKIGRTVAIKVLKKELARDAELVARFLREARAAGALSHANIATIFDVGQVEGTPYIAMELVEGSALDEVLAAQGRMPFERVLHLARQIAEALAYAHDAGVIHRDIKPSNILISSDGRTAKLVDFGVARISEAGAGGLAKTHAGQLIGTPRYMSPEQALGLPVDHRTDLFSLGAVLYELVTGKVAFPGSGLATLAIQIAQEGVEPIGRGAADCPAGFNFIIEKLLAKKPERRFANGAALVAAIDREINAAKESQQSRRGLTLRIKLPLALVVITALALGFSVQAISDRQQRALELMAAASGNSMAAFVAGNAAVVAADNAGLSADDQDWAPLQAFVSAAAQDAEVHYIQVVDERGIIRAANHQGMIGRPYSAPLNETVLMGRSSIFEAADTGAGTGLRFVRPIKYAGAEFGTVNIVLSRHALDNAITTSRTLLAVLSGLVMAVVFVVGYLSAAFVARPLKRLREALDQAADSGFALRLSHNRKDEFGETFDAFNRAASKVEWLSGQTENGYIADPGKTLLVTEIAA